MARVDLGVPFAEKDDAKSLGARWDSGAKTWFVPDGVDATPFDRWLPQPPMVNIRSDRYFIAEALGDCWNCDEETQLFGIVLPAGHEVLVPIDEEEAGFGPDDDFDQAAFEAWDESPESKHWIASEEPTLLRYVSYYPPAVLERLLEHTDKLRPRETRGMPGMTHYANHCTCCGAKQGDHAVAERGPLAPGSLDDIATIVLHEVDEVFEGCGDTGRGTYVFDEYGRIGWEEVGLQDERLVDRGRLPAPGM